MVVKLGSPDVPMMKSPGLWPIYPRLALKHSRVVDADGMPKLGWMHVRSGFNVHLGCMFLSETGVEEHASAEAVFEAGWLVD